ncbi:hypothetical protein GIB67_011970 [Kingdonia uniflora]|uniref:NAC domain-containing protein n=1 Tax=Kingdonia uniflora TaxID=39325 RepID=A0A7J7LZZ9_9MAGN|nr:hypothetical protein GIB67_011970 [Kingdonia uniflora]
MENNLDEEIGLVLPPGFRFYPTDEELITHYLSPKVSDSSFSTTAIGEVDLNKCEPWDLPWEAKMGETEWYFFWVRDRKYPTGLRANRATEAGYWKATGKDKEILRGKVIVGMKKTLVFYRGRAPKGEKSGWVMHEYRIHDKSSVFNLSKPAKTEWTLCRIFEKSAGGKKIHISSMVRSSPEKDLATLILPPLIDSTPYISKIGPVVAETGHVTCFSRMPLTGSFYSTQVSFGQSNPLFPNPVFFQQQTYLKDIMENPGSKMRQDCTAKKEMASLSQDTGLTNDINTQISSRVQPSFDELLDTLSSTVQIGNYPWIS